MLIASTAPPHSEAAKGTRLGVRVALALVNFMVPPHRPRDGDLR
jgi:hypothetical protein